MPFFGLVLLRLHHQLLDLILLLLQLGRGDRLAGELVARNVVPGIRFLSCLVVAQDHDVLTVITPHVLLHCCLLVLPELGLKLAVGFRVHFAWLIGGGNLTRKCALGVLRLIILLRGGSRVYIHYI